MTDSILRVDGQVANPRHFSYEDLTQILGEFQIDDVRSIDPSRDGAAVLLEGILQASQVRDSAQFIGFHSSHDDFHASIPLSEVRQKGIVIYRLNDAPLPREKGGPVRFYIPDHASCNTDDIDECANVKFVDRIELTIERGFDNRPEDEGEHARLHEQDG